jgi:hypothetical protein
MPHCLIKAAKIAAAAGKLKINRSLSHSKDSKAP